MEPAIDFSGWNLAALRSAWRAAAPFGHVVLDGVLPEPALTALCEAVAAEPHWPERGEICDMMGSAEPPAHPTLRAFHEALAGEQALAAMSEITGKALRSLETRSYVYVDGSYLLPHTDYRPGLGREVAYALYLWTAGCKGGELELFDCVVSGDAVSETRAALRIRPEPNRLVLFDVTPGSLHQVCEVLGGARVSLAGWYCA